jgi:hypothetical protein
MAVRSLGGGGSSGFTGRESDDKSCAGGLRHSGALADFSADGLANLSIRENSWCQDDVPATVGFINNGVFDIWGFQGNESSSRALVLGLRAWAGHERVC